MSTACRPIPQTVAGLASQLQQAINNALAVSLPRASVACSAVPSGAGTGICVNALLPNQPDAVISFSVRRATDLLNTPVNGPLRSGSSLTKVQAFRQVRKFFLGSHKAAFDNIFTARLGL